MKNERLLAMVDVFLHEGRKSAEELSDRFEVSVRTIYRDVDALCSAGVPLVSYAGAGGGYELEESYRIDRSFLSKEEIADLTGLLKGFSEVVKDRHLERSLGKIASLGPRSTRAEPSQPALPPPFIATFAPWGTVGPDASLVDSVRRAVAERRLISFCYQDGEGRGTERTVEPFSVVISVATWYLHGWCRLRSSFRLFKLSRVRNLLVLPEVYDPYARIPIPAPFVGGDESVVGIRLSVDPKIRAVVAESFPDAIEEPGADGPAVVFSFEYPTGPWFTRFLLYLGPGLRVLAPDSLRKEYAAAARSMLARNEE
ncbi:MAG: YafY family protein [Treponemataceae bacterium]